MWKSIANILASLKKVNVKSFKCMEKSVILISVTVDFMLKDQNE